jgi:hypothetical protein
VLVRVGSRRPLTGRAALGTLVASLGIVGLPALASAAAPTTPFISEIHYDNAGADVGEFVEIHLPPGTTSEGLSVVLYNGNGGGTYGSTALPVVTATDTAAVAVVEYTGTLQNGAPDGLALVRSDGTVAEFLSYEGTFTATAGPAAGMLSTDIGSPRRAPSPLGSRSRARTTRPRTPWSGPARPRPPRARPTAG